MEDRTELTLAIRLRDLVEPPGSVHVLVVVAGKHLGARYRVENTRTLGREPSCSIHLEDHAVSRLHCEVALMDGRVVVTDRGSTNGTFVDGEPVVGSAVLPPSGQLRLGEHVLRHELRTPAEAAREEEFARDLVKAMSYVAALLPEPISRPGLCVEWAFQPCAALGGDLLGYHWIAPRRLALYVVDVCGHGVGPAMHSASVFNSIRNRTLPETDFGVPGEVLGRLNDSFPMESHGNLYLTVWYGVLDLEHHTLRFASAGHPPALLVDRAGRAQRLATPNPPIGTLEGRVFREECVNVAPGARLHVFSDGAYELTSRGDTPFDFERFEAIVVRNSHGSAGRAEAIRCEVLAAAANAVLDDDFSLLVVTVDD
jgi:serine phosphatase RsbU (regulator of sigma subunit)